MGFLSKLLGGKPSRDEFVEIVLKELHAVFPGRKITLHGGETFCLEIEGLTNFYLSNAYQDYCAAASNQDRKGVLDRYLATLSDVDAHKSTDLFETCQDRFFPQVRHASFFGYSALQLKTRGITEPLDCPATPLVGDLSVTLVIDSPSSVSSVSSKQLDGWKKSFNDVYQVALHNLSSTTIGKLQLIHEGLYAAPWQDIYNASRILLPGILDGLLLKGNPVAIVPTRNALFVTGSEDTCNLCLLRKLIEDSQEHGRHVSAVPLVQHSGNWQVLELPVSHPAYQDLYLLRILERVRDYADQAPLVSQLVGEDFFVAKFNATQHKDTGKISTYAVWSEDVPTVLPAAERVAFMRTHTDMAIYLWEDVARNCNHLMEPMGLIPERYKVRTFPDDDILNRMVRID